MIRKSADGIQWLEFEILAEQKGIIHGIFLRDGGMNSEFVALGNVGDKKEEEMGALEENRNRFLLALNIERFVSCVQVHGNRVVHVEDDFQNMTECDGLITKETNLGLMIKHADCQAAIFYDPIHKALANVHSGWRGNVKNIYGVTIGEMARAFGTKPQDLLVGVSPS